MGGRLARQKLVWGNQSPQDPGFDVETYFFGDICLAVKLFRHQKVEVVVQVKCIWRDALLANAGGTIPELVVTY